MGASLYTKSFLEAIPSIFFGPIFYPFKCTGAAEACKFQTFTVLDTINFKMSFFNSIRSALGGATPDFEEGDAHETRSSAPPQPAADLESSEFPPTHADTPRAAVPAGKRFALDDEDDSPMGAAANNPDDPLPTVEDDGFTPIDHFFPRRAAVGPWGYSQESTIGIDIEDTQKQDKPDSPKLVLQVVNPLDHYDPLDLESVRKATEKSGGNPPPRLSIEERLAASKIGMDGVSYNVARHTVDTAGRKSP